MKKSYKSESFSIGKFSLLTIVSAAIFMSSCLRYTPSRTEIEKDRESSSSKEIAANIVSDEKAFTQYEEDAKKRLGELVSERSALLTQNPSESGYAVGPGDRVATEVFGLPELSSESEISPAGTLALPLVGEVQVQGLSPGDLRSKLTKAYTRFVRSPQVSVTMKEYRFNRVSVIGEVAKPGVYPLRRQGQLITELLSEAGGRTDKASGRLILLPAPKLVTTQVASNVPVSAGSTQTLGAATQGVELDMDELIGRIDQRPLLLPLVAGDTIVVPEAGSFEVDGEVQKPGSYKLASKTSALGAVAAAGGFSYAANVKEVEILRDIGGGKKASRVMDMEEIALRGANDIRLRDGDIIRVPSEPGRFMRRQIVESINSLFRGVGANAQVQ